MSEIVRVMTDKKNYEDIAKAIRRHTGDTEFYYPEEMAHKIDLINPGKVNLQDICNHGVYENDSNPYYNTSTFYNISSGNVNYSRWNFTNQGIIRGNSGWDYSRATITMPIDKRVFSKVCCKAVIMDRTSTQYNNFTFQLGVFKKSRGHTYDGYDKYVAIGWQEGNYAGTTPCYQMPETEIKLDVSDLDEDFYYIRMISCDLQCKFTEVWLEP